MITMTDAVQAWRKGNDAGDGFLPIVSGEESFCPGVDGAVEDHVNAGWTVVLARTSDDEVAVLESMNGVLIAIGDLHGSWAVYIN